MIKNENKLVEIPEWLANEMVSYLYTSGLLIKNKDLTSAVHLPVVVFPSPIVKSLFEKIEFYQIAFNKMVDSMSRDYEFLHSVLQPISEEDSFIKRHLEISTKASNFPQKQGIQLGIFRNDFMIDQFKKFIFQIEINTISVSCASFTDGLKKFYQFFSEKYPEYYRKYFEGSVPVHREDIVSQIGKAMSSACKLFDPEYFEKNLVIFIVQENEKNEYEQRIIENELWIKHKIYSRRLTLKQFLKEASYNSNMDILINSKRVSLVYFRAAYSEKDFSDEECWKAREMIELSTAIKCPNVDTFLCTFKVFQYYLQKSEVMSKFFPEPLIANDISRFFTKIYYVKEMTNEEKTSIFKEIRTDPNKYIVKPQKEGGGNNYYNEQILTLLPGEEAGVENLNPELTSSLIMQRINPPESETYVLHENKLKKINGISEVSTFGIILSTADKKIILNQNAGYLVRTKDKNIQEGGIVAGFSAVDLPFLVDFNLKDNSVLKYD